MKRQILAIAARNEEGVDDRWKWPDSLSECLSFLTSAMVLVEN